jgi:hypothetical protein
MTRLFLGLGRFCRGLSSWSSVGLPSGIDQHLVDLKHALLIVVGVVV